MKWYPNCRWWALHLSSQGFVFFFHFIVLARAMSAALALQSCSQQWDWRMDFCYQQRNLTNRPTDWLTAAGKRQLYGMRRGLSLLQRRRSRVNICLSCNPLIYGWNVERSDELWFIEIPCCSGSECISENRIPLVLFFLENYLIFSMRS